MFLITSFAQGSNPGDRPLVQLRQLFAEFRAARAEQGRRRAAFARVRQELNAYTDRELNDLGVARGDIDRLAREAASF